MRNIYLVFFLLFAITATSMAQGRRSSKKQDRRRFKADVILGACGAQIDGDNYVGYNKLGVSGGVRGVVVLNKSFDLNIELLFQQKGSRFESTEGGKRNRKIHLNYMEVPFLIRYYPDKKDQGLNLDFGFAFSRLIGTKITESNIPDKVRYESIVEDFTSNEISFIAGLAIKITPTISLGGRCSYSISRFFDDPEGVGPVPVSQGGGQLTEVVFFLRNYMIGGYLAYSF